MFYTVPCIDKSAPIAAVSSLLGLVEYVFKALGSPEAAAAAAAARVDRVLTLLLLLLLASLSLPTAISITGLVLFLRRLLVLVVAALLVIHALVVWFRAVALVFVLDERSSVASPEC